MKIAAALLLVLVVAGCGSDEKPSSNSTPTSPPATTTAPPTTEAPKSVTVDVVVANGKITPVGKRVEAKVGEPINLRVTSDAAEEIHVHSDPEQSFAISAGQSKTFTFTIDRPGKVAVEGHEIPVTIVELLVRP